MWKKGIRQLRLISKFMLEPGKQTIAMRILVDIS